MILYIFEKRTKYKNTWNKYFDEFCQIASFDAHKYLFWCTFPTYDSRAFLTANHYFYDETRFASLLAFWHTKMQSLWIEKKDLWHHKSFFAPKSIPCTDEEETYVHVEFSSCLLKMFYLYSYPEILLRVENILKSIFYA